MLFARSVSLLVILCGSSVFASSPGSLFVYDENRVAEELVLLNELEAYLEASPGTTLITMIEEGHPLTPSGSYSLSDQPTDPWYPPMGIPSFWWGFGTGFCGGTAGACITVFYPFAAPLVFSGLIGVFVVKNHGGDNFEFRQSIYGCTAGTLSGLAITAASVVLLFLYILNLETL